MPRKKLAQKIAMGNGAPASSDGSFDPDKLKKLVLDGLTSIAREERADFAEALEADLRRVDMTMRSYLILLGIPAMTPAELTPAEVGHLIRFLSVNVPRAKPVVERAIARLQGLGDHGGGSTDRLAA
jgi:hypothetical protein